MKKELLLLISGIFVLSACTSSTAPSSNNFRCQGIDFGVDRDADYRKGVCNACRPIDCGYTRDINKLKNNESYRKGWEDGLLKCKGKGKEEHLYGI